MFASVPEVILAADIATLFYRWDMQTYLHSHWLITPNEEHTYLLWKIPDGLNLNIKF